MIATFLTSYPASILLVFCYKTIDYRGLTSLHRPGQEGGSTGTCPGVQASAAPGQSDLDGLLLQAHTHLQVQTCWNIIDSTQSNSLSF